MPGVLSFRRVHTQFPQIPTQEAPLRHLVTLATGQESPILIPSEYAGGLKAGQFLVFEGGIGKERAGLPLVGFADEKQTKIVSFLGQKL